MANTQLPKRWPSAKQLTAIARAAHNLASCIQKYAQTSNPKSHVNAKQRATFVREDTGSVIRSIEKLDYLVHGRTIANYENDRKAWQHAGLPVTLHRWIVGTPTKSELARLDVLSTKRKRRLEMATIDGWCPRVTDAYRRIIVTLAAIKFYFDHLPVLSVDQWERVGLSDKVRKEIEESGGDASDLPCLETSWRRAVWYDASTPPPEIEQAGGVKVLRDGGLPFGWTMVLRDCAGSINSEIHAEAEDLRDPSGELRRLEQLICNLSTLQELCETDASNNDSKTLRRRQPFGMWSMSGGELSVQLREAVAEAEKFGIGGDASPLLRLLNIVDDPIDALDQAIVFAERLATKQISSADDDLPTETPSTSTPILTDAKANIIVHADTEVVSIGGKPYQLKGGDVIKERLLKFIQALIDADGSPISAADFNVRSRDVAAQHPDVCSLINDEAKPGAGHCIPRSRLWRR